MLLNIRNMQKLRKNLINLPKKKKKTARKLEVKCDWYEHKEKSSKKFFLYLEKSREVEK